MTSSTQRVITRRIQAMPQGSVFSAKDMAASGSRAAVDQALRRLFVAGSIRRIHWGLYEKPKSSKLLGVTLGPDIDKVAHALARKFNWHIMPTGSTTLNQLGISTQVPGRHTYLSNGPTRRYGIGKSTIDFRHVASKDMNILNKESARVVHAIKALGDRPLDDDVVAGLKTLLVAGGKEQLLKDTSSATSWVHDRIRQLCEEP